MILDIIANFLFSLLSLLWNSFLFSIPVFLIVFFAGRPLHSFFKEKAGRSWLQSAFLASYVVLFVLLIIAFFFPVWLAVQNSAIGTAPEEIRLTAFDLFGQYLSGLIRMALVAGLFSLLILPFIFLGEFFKDWLEEKIPRFGYRFFIAVFMVVFIAWFLLLFLFSWVIPGLVYLIYWA